MARCELSDQALAHRAMAMLRARRFGPGPADARLAAAGVEARDERQTRQAVIGSSGRVIS